MIKYFLLWIFVISPVVDSTSGFLGSQNLLRDHKGYRLIDHDSSEECSSFLELCLDEVKCCTGLTCRNNKCCVDQKCSDPSEYQTTLYSATQWAMGGAMLIGVLTIIALFWKICSSVRHRGRREPTRNRTRGSTRTEVSVDSLQQIVTERLRDAPPSYIRSITHPIGDTPPPYDLVSSGHTNPCFDPDYNTPPPSYSAVAVQEDAPRESEARNNTSVKDTTTDANVDAMAPPKDSVPLPDPILHM